MGFYRLIKLAAVYEGNESVSSLSALMMHFILGCLQDFTRRRRMWLGTEKNVLIRIVIAIKCIGKC